jgi:hypothetical protein
MGTPAAAAPAAPSKPAKPAGPPPGGRHREPFLVPWHVPPAPPYIFTEVEPIRLARADVQTPAPPNTEIHEMPTRRVSGIMTGDGVYAILESGTSEPEIVKPGSLTTDGYRVISINADSVKLQRKDGNYLLTQIVPLSDIPPGSATVTAGYRGGFQGGYPGGGNPGGYPGARQGGFNGGGAAGGGKGETD